MTLAVAGLALAACSSDSSNATTTAAGGSSGTLNWEWPLPSSWDPVTSSQGWDVHALSLVYSGITSLDAKGDAVPGLAQSWQYSDDGKTLTFTLRPGLTFSDGTALDAAAVKTNILRGQDDPKSLIASQLSEITSVDVTSPTVVVLHLSQADYQLPNVLAGKTGMVVSPAAIKKGDTALATNPVGDGPFLLKQYVPDSHANLTKNPGYYNSSAIKLPALTIQLITQPEQILSALKTGAVNVAYIQGNLAGSAKAAGFKIQSIPAMTVYELDVKTSVAPFNNPKVAEAANYAIDRQALVATQQAGYGAPAYQPFPPGYVGYDQSVANLYPHDPAKSKQLLAEAGFTQPVPITLTTVAQYSSISEQLQAQLDAGGFKVTLQEVPLDQYSTIVYIQKQAQIAVDSTAGRESPLQMLQVLYGAKGLLNLTGQESPAAASAFAAVQKTPLTSPDYPATLHNAVSVTSKDPASPHIWLFSYPRLFAESKSVSDLPEDFVVQRFEGVQVKG